MVQYYKIRDKKMTQLNLLENDNHCPQWVLDAVDWAQNRNGELVMRVRGVHGLGAWLRQNLHVKATNLDGEYLYVKATSPAWANELAVKKWRGALGSQHPANYVNWD